MKRPGVHRWELRKLVALKRTYLGLGFAAVMPLIFVIALAARNEPPRDVPFGRYALDSGLAVPLVAPHLRVSSAGRRSSPAASTRDGTRSPASPAHRSRSATGWS